MLNSLHEKKQTLFEGHRKMDVQKGSGIQNDICGDSWVRRGQDETP